MTSLWGSLEGAATGVSGECGAHELGSSGGAPVIVTILFFALALIAISGA